MAVLVVIGGLPATGKTTVSRAAAGTVDIPDLVLPTWPEIVNRDYEPWDRPHVVLDTAGKAAQDTVTELFAVLGIGRISGASRGEPRWEWRA